MNGWLPPSIPTSPKRAAAQFARVTAACEEIGRDRNEAVGSELVGGRTLRAAVLAGDHDVDIPLRPQRA